MLEFLRKVNGSGKTNTDFCPGQAPQKVETCLDTGPDRLQPRIAACEGGHASFDDIEVEACPFHSPADEDALWNILCRVADDGGDVDNQQAMGGRRRRHPRRIESESPQRAHTSETLGKPRQHRSRSRRRRRRVESESPRRAHASKTKRKPEEKQGKPSRNRSRIIASESPERPPAPGRTQKTAVTSHLGRGGSSSNVEKEMEESSALPVAHQRRTRGKSRPGETAPSSAAPPISCPRTPDWQAQNACEQASELPTVVRRRIRTKSSGRLGEAAPGSTASLISCPTTPNMTWEAAPGSTASLMSCPTTPNLTCMYMPLKPPAPDGTWECPACGETNRSTRKQCNNCRQARPVSEATGSLPCPQTPRAAARESLSTTGGPAPASPAPDAALRRRRITGKSPDPRGAPGTPLWGAPATPQGFGPAPGTPTPTTPQVGAPAPTTPRLSVAPGTPRAVVPGPPPKPAPRAQRAAAPGAPHDAAPARPRGAARNSLAMGCEAPAGTPRKLFAPQPAKPGKASKSQAAVLGKRLCEESRPAKGTRPQKSRRVEPPSPMHRRQSRPYSRTR
mmetsp:Transcript_17993/g.33408  ORF Transcript_17993/g.33408 Transcript_17993/m.33408 type:complete len:564 (+) Transcript_17993:73-1764(+)